MGSEDCERHVETKIYRADAWRICSDLNFESFGHRETAENS